MDISFSAYSAGLFADPGSGFSLDVSRISLPEEFLTEQQPQADRALREMREIESGALANHNERRMVGHYWLRSPERAPSAMIREDIEQTIRAIKEFADGVRSARLLSSTGQRFTRTHIIGIGGSALGPQFVADSLVSATDRMRVSFFDNTDPDGMERVLLDREFRLSETLVLVVSKSGGTKETRNGELVMKRVLQSAGISWPSHFVAITGQGSELDKRAQEEGWLARFPMWDWVGGRTSELSAVGLLPAALQGVAIDQLLAGAAHLDSLSRRSAIRENPAMMLALAWFRAGNGQGDRAMVVLPYKDRLQLFSRYLQQLVMESLGKELDRDGNRVNQGIVVYGNKGSTDQHAYVQQLRDGRDDFFVTFLEALEDGGDGRRSGAALIKTKDVEVEPGVFPGDYLFGFLYGTRAALTQQGRPSIVVTIPRVDEFSIGLLIALFERAVGFYASFVNINAYDQPGVEAGKQAADRILAIQKSLSDFFSGHADARALSMIEVCRDTDLVGHEEIVFQILRRWAANGKGSMTNVHRPGDAQYLHSVRRPSE